MHHFILLTKQDGLKGKLQARLLVPQPRPVTAAITSKSQMVHSTVKSNFAKKTKLWNEPAGAAL
jgi:hypothetical protein